MISWQEIQEEVAQAQPIHQSGAIDFVRRKAYSDFVEISGRPLLVYATAFQHPFKGGNFGGLMSIDLTDKDGFAEIIDSVQGRKIDILIHSPGGSPEATESIVDMLRAHFNDVRFIVTGTAKSAATMLCMSGNNILVSTAGELGPIDPQVNMGGSFAPAGSLKEEFQKAAQEISEDPEKLPVWLPILEKYPPALLIQCDNFIQLGKDLVTKWLKSYMFKGDPDKKEKAAKIAEYLADEKNSLSHARRIDAKTLERLGVKLERVERQSTAFQEALRKVHLCIALTLDGTDAVKIYENSDGKAFIRQINLMPQQIVNPMPQ
ncbi:S49 family peptidase [soil metagenome]